MWKRSLVGTLSQALDTRAMALIDRFLPHPSSDKSPSRSEGSRESRERRTSKRMAIIAHTPGSSIGGTSRLDFRRFLGAVLVVCSLVGGYLATVRADQRSDVMALVHDIAPGQVLTANDFRFVKAAVPNGLYAQKPSQLIGQSTTSILRAGELIPLSQIAEGVKRNLVAIPIRSTSLPTLVRGDRVAIWTVEGVIASDLAVEEVTKESTTRVITLGVSDSDLPTVVAVLSSEIFLVKLP